MYVYVKRRKKCKKGVVKNVKNFELLIYVWGIIYGCEKKNQYKRSKELVSEKSKKKCIMSNMTERSYK